MQNFFILKDKKAVPCDIQEWSEWCEKNDRGVKRAKIGKYFISTIFLGINHQLFDDDRPPILFETMVLNADSEEWEDEQERYSTWDQAEKGHAKIVKKYEKINLEEINSKFKSEV